MEQVEGVYAGLRDGLWKNWERESDGWVDSTETYLSSSGPLLRGKRHGIWTFWYGNGRKSSEGEFRDNFLAGDWTFWSQDGSIHEEETGFYENGVKIR